MRDSKDSLIAAILDDDRRKAVELVRADGSLVTTLTNEARLYEAPIFHWIYVGDTALHLAAAGYRVEIVELLLSAGADPNAATNHRRSTPLHRAVRTRCAAAVKYLLEAGCDPILKNKPGSTAFHLAVQDTGRGGSGAMEARVAQREIIQTFLSLGVITALQDGKGNSVMDCARSGWIQAILSDHGAESRIH